MTLEEFFHSVGAYHGDSKNLSATTLRAFVRLIETEAAKFPADDFILVFARIKKELGLANDENS